MTTNDHIENNPYITQIGDDLFAVNDDDGNPIWTGDWDALTEAIAATTTLAAEMAVRDGITTREALARIGEQYGGTP